MSVHELALKHYADVPQIELDRSFPYAGRMRRDKPSGFWVSVEGEDDWKQWCVGEEFNVDRLDNEHDVKLKSSAEIFLIDSLPALHDFSASFCDHPTRWVDAIQWETLAEYYDGVIIAPYQWSARLDPRLSWYYSWDVASGCIWNLDVIESVAPVKSLTGVAA